MKILAGSLQTAADTFLHAGYISAYPRPYYPHNYGYQTPKLELDMMEALRLKGEVLASGALPDGVVATAQAVAGGFSGPQLLVAGLGLVGLGLAFKLRRDWRRALLPMLASVALLLISPSCGETEEPLPTVPPWQGKQVQAYENPELATKALLHGVVADALSSMGREVTSLANIQNEVGLPLASPGAGMKYALIHYGQDGWGKEMRLTRNGARYQVTSAGKDGKFDTSDDLKAQVSGCSDSNWDQYRYGHFIRDDGGEAVLLIHRWTGEHFKYNDQNRATRLTGSVLFDAIDESKLSDKGKTLTKNALAAAAAKAKHKPLLLHVFN